MSHITHYCKTLVVSFINDIVFTSDSIALFHSAMKTNSYFIRAKLYPLERIVGSFKFRGRRCEACLNVTETETFIIASANQNYKIKHKFSCNESSRIQFLTCRSVVSNMLDKQLLFFAVDGIIIKLMTKSIYNLSQSPFGFGFFTSLAV